MVSVEERAAQLAVHAAFTSCTGLSPPAPDTLAKLRAALSAGKKGRAAAASEVARRLATPNARRPAGHAAVVGAVLDGCLGDAVQDLEAGAVLLDGCATAREGDGEAAAGADGGFSERVASLSAWSAHGTDLWLATLRKGVAMESTMRLRRESAAGGAMPRAEVARQIVERRLPLLVSCALAFGVARADVVSLVEAANAEFGSSTPAASLLPDDGPSELAGSLGAAPGRHDRTTSVSSTASSAVGDARGGAGPTLPRMLAGELPVWRVQAGFTSGAQTAHGTLLLTTYRLAFCFDLRCGAYSRRELEAVLPEARVNPDFPYAAPPAGSVSAGVGHDAGGAEAVAAAHAVDCIRGMRRWAPPVVSVPLLAVERTKLLRDPRGSRSVLVVRCKDHASMYFVVSEDDVLEGRLAGLLQLISTYGRANFDCEREAAVAEDASGSGGAVQSASPLPRPFAYAHAQAVRASPLAHDGGLVAELPLGSTAYMLGLRASPSAAPPRASVSPMRSPVHSASHVLPATAAEFDAAASRTRSATTAVMLENPMGRERSHSTSEAIDAGAAAPSGAAAAASDVVDGWTLYDVDVEFRRQGALASAWAASNVNHRYELCSTYPRRLIVPQGTIESSLRKVASFRSRERLAVLTWYCKHNNGALLRSSQPKVGILGRESEGDQRLLEAARVRVIFDARPRKNALGNRAMGKGTEIAADYTDLELVFLDIENIHVMRTSCQRLRALLDSTGTIDVDGVRDPGTPGGSSGGSSGAVSRLSRLAGGGGGGSGGAGGDGGAGVGGEGDDAVADFQGQLSATKWLFHVQACMRGAARVVSTVWDEGRTALVHCSDGWDRTSQISALAQLCMDPYYRTMRGFCVLVEKDWCSFGHMFEKRLGHGSDDFHDEQRSPIFLQFMDSVWQVWRQFRRSFEFNERFIDAVAHHAYSCRFGTFLFNCERERVEARLAERTESLWTFLLAHRAGFRNPHYRHRTSPIRPATAMHALALWPYHARMYPAMQVPEAPPMPESVDLRLVKQRDELLAEVARLRALLAASGVDGNSRNDTEPESKTAPAADV
uniref:Myotubularin phosphatase domain-containing protein n=1 Tax=Bicosoecida sp. CB-2014 TaxID=1486930 RepID=A0A7S1CHB4_9STRA|mmetsp:Transcript_24194/g.84014  ORF Transcript_24194/g.84014 Transcript_24194/m.84014 type:complete len:1061 (+) Transcript_24194:192-3374(+)